MLILELFLYWFILFNFLNYILMKIDNNWLYNTTNNLFFSNFTNLLIFSFIICLFFIILRIVWFFIKYFIWTSIIKKEKIVNKLIFQTISLNIILVIIWIIFFKVFSIENKNFTQYSVNENKYIYVNWNKNNFLVTDKDIYNNIIKINSKIKDKNHLIDSLYVFIQTPKDELTYFLKKNNDKKSISTEKSLDIIWWYYNPSSNNIYINSIQTTLNFWSKHEVIIHELWHWFWENKFSHSDQILWENLFKQSFYKDWEIYYLNWQNKDYLTQYSKTNFKEDFAEFFMLYVTNKDFILNKIKKEPNSLLKEKITLVEKYLK